MARIINKNDFQGKVGIDKVKSFGLNVIESIDSLIESNPNQKRNLGNFLMTLVREFREVSQEWKQNRIQIDAEIKDLDKNETIALIVIFGCAFANQVLKLNNISQSEILKLIDNDSITAIANAEKPKPATKNKSKTTTDKTGVEK